MKKLMLVLLPFMLYFNAYAGDLPETVIHLPDADVFIGEITEIDDGIITVSVYRALFQNYDVEIVTFNEFDYMTYDDKHRTPEIGDYVAAAVEYKDGAWEILYSDESGRGGLVAKSDGLDPETLKLYAGGHGFTERMNAYINNGDYSYENRMRLNGNEDSQNKTPHSDRGDERALLTQDAISKKIAEETEIVVPPPEVKDKSVGKLSGKPFARYAFMTAVSAVISFVVAKRAVRKRRAK